MNEDGVKGELSPDNSMWKGFYFFLAFVILAGFAIQVTSTLPGIEQHSENSPLTQELELAFIGNEIVDIEYFESNWTYSHIGLIEDSDDNRILYTQTSPGTDGVMIISSPSTSGLNSEQIPEILESKDNVFWISDRVGSLTAVTIGETYTSVTFEGELGNSSFEEISVANGDENHMLMLTRTGSSSNIWGSNSGGIVKVENDRSGVAWSDATQLSDDKWLVSGISTPAFSENGNSPATPTQRGVIGLVTFGGQSGGIDFEILETSDTTIHTLQSLDSGAIAVSEDMFWHFESEDDYTIEEINSATAMVDADQRVWFFYEGGFEFLQRYDSTTGEIEILELAKNFEIFPESSSSTDTHIFVHGADSFGADSFISVDLTYPKSLQSGRGFLNWAFLMVGTSMLVVLGMYTLRGISGEEF